MKKAKLRELLRSRETTNKESLTVKTIESDQIKKNKKKKGDK